MWYFLIATVIAVGFWRHKSTLQTRVDQAKTEEEKKRSQEQLNYWKSWNIWVILMVVVLVGYGIWEWSEERQRRHGIARLEQNRRDRNRRIWEWSEERLEQNRQDRNRRQAEQASVLARIRREEDENAYARRKAKEIYQHPDNSLTPYFAELRREQLHSMLSTYGRNPAQMKVRLRGWIQNKEHSPTERIRKLAALEKFDEYVRSANQDSVDIGTWSRFMGKPYGSKGIDDKTNRPMSIEDLDEFIKIIPQFRTDFETELKRVDSDSYEANELMANHVHPLILERDIAKTREKIRRNRYAKSKKSLNNPEFIGRAFVKMQRQYPLDAISQIREFLYGPRESFPNWKQNIQYTTVPRSIAPRKSSSDMSYLGQNFRNYFVE